MKSKLEIQQEEDNKILDIILKNKIAFLINKKLTYREVAYILNISRQTVLNKLK